MAATPTSDAEWQAQSDARTLAEAEQIKADAQRLTRAQAKARGMADEKAQDAAALRRVAGGKASGGSIAPTSARSSGSMGRAVK